MGFYLRKSLRAGPIRINLSKSGVGMSVGVTGARVGISSRGRSYVHAGRGGVYFRESLGSSARTRVGTAGGGTQVQYEHTGVTYDGPTAPRLPVPTVPKRVRASSAIYLVLPVAGAVCMYLGATSAAIGSLILRAAGGILAASYLYPAWLAWSHNRAGDRLGAILRNAFAARRPLQEGEWGTIQSVLVIPAVTPADREFQSRDAYRRLVSDIAADGQVTAPEESLLAQIESTLPIGDAFAERIRADAFRRAYVDAVSDGVLTQHEEDALGRLRTALRVRSEVVADELTFMARLRAIRKVREGDLAAVVPPVRLAEAEMCHFVGPARVLKERVLRSYQQDNQRYSVHGLVVDAEGTLLITSKRILIVHGGSTSILYPKVLDIEVDVDQNLFSIAKENAANPVLVTTPDSLMAAAIAATAAGL